MIKRSLKKAVAWFENSIMYAIFWICPRCARFHSTTSRILFACVWVISVWFHVLRYGTTLGRFIFRLICATICFIAHTCEHRAVRCKCVENIECDCDSALMYKLSSVTDGWADRPTKRPREKQHQQHQQQQSIATNSSPLIICFGGYAIVSRFHFNKTLFI